MGAGNTIGTGAVVLTANADQMLAGLDKAAGATDKWAKKTATAATKPAAGGRGGLLSGLLFGTGVGAGIGAALGALGAVEGFASRFADIGERTKKYSNLSPSMLTGAVRTQKAFDRISGAVDEFVFRAAARLAPLFERVADVAERVGFVASEAFGLLADNVETGARALQEWIDKTFGLSTATTTAADQIMAGIRGAVKVMVFGMDLVSKSIGSVLVLVGQAFEALSKTSEFTRGFADGVTGALTLRGLWGDKLAEGTTDAKERLAGLADQFKKVGLAAERGFGGLTTAGIDKWFDEVEAKFKATDRLQKKWEGNFLGGAFKMNSSEAVSVVNKFNAGNMISDGQKRRENLLREIRDGIHKVEDKLNPLGAV